MITQSAKCLAYKHEDPSLSPQTHVKCQTCDVLVTPSLGKEKEGALGLIGWLV